MESVTSLMARHTHHIQNVTTLLCYAKALTIWSTAHLPNAARSSANFLLHVIIPVVMDLRFLFLLSNLIIISLLFLSRSPPSLILPKPHLQIEEEEKNKKTVLMAQQVKEEELAVSTMEPEKEIRTKKHVKGSSLRRARSLTTAAVVRMQMVTELRRARTNLKIEKERDDKEFRDVIEAFIEKQRKFSEAENNHVSH